MKKSRFSEEQIVRILNEVKAGSTVRGTCARHNIGEQTYYGLSSTLASATAAPSGRFAGEKEAAANAPRRSGHGRAPARAAPRQVWSWDFVEDQTEKGTRFRILTLIDEYTRQCLTVHAAYLDLGAGCHHRDRSGDGTLRRSGTPAQ